MNAKQVMAKHPELHAWMLKGENSWARKMMDGLRSYDKLSDKQIEVSLRIMNETARPAPVKVEPPKPLVNAQAIQKAFATAKARGIAKPKMRLDNFKFSAAPDNGRNPGAIYVTSVDGQTYLGRINEGVLTTTQNASEEIVKEIQAVCDNPAESAKAYGLRTGVCCICSRKLTNGESIDMGIGPICAEKFGF